jgi:hypothetical protein
MVNPQHSTCRNAKRVLVASFLAAGSMLVACGTTPSGSPDASTDVDAAKQPAGLTVNWALSQPLPTKLADRELTAVGLRMKSLRFVGDVAPDDARCNRMQLTLIWNATSSPESVRFEQAPVGPYSDIKTRIDGDAFASFEIYGRALVAGSWIDFEVEDTSTITQTIPVNVTVTPDKGQAVTLAADWVAILNSLDFSKFDNEGVKLELRSGSELSKVRGQISKMFSIKR